MDYTREDDRKFAEAVGIEDTICYVLSMPTAVSDQWCLIWARKMSPGNVAWFVSEVVTLWRDRNNANYKADWNNEWLLYEVGDYARALYAVLMEE